MVYIDDSIMQKGVPATAGSKILENFIAPIDATVVTRLNQETRSFKMAEFGLGDPGELPAAPLLCNDIFGHVRSRAAKQGLCYIHPTYGTVSRFGLIPLACSMDQIGIVCSTPAEGFALLSKIAGHDEKDGAMFAEKNYTYKAAAGELKWAAVLNPDIEKKFVEQITVYSDVYNDVFKILVYAELCNNISRYDGIKFGYRAANYKGLEDLYLKTRTDGFGREAKLAAIMGCLVLSQNYYEKYYDKAMKIRRLIKESLRFDKYDIIAMPVNCPLAELAGLPSLTFSHNGKSIQLAAEVKNENALFSAWENLK
ncbi:MAG: amidase family protein [Treponema sp.]|nr:amidase family protein [Treponema sp.]